MSEVVLADAQFSAARVLKPYAGFEEVYEGQEGSVPISVPGGRDSNAGKPGYNPNLVLGAPVPYGSKGVLWLPNPPLTRTTPGPVEIGYAFAYKYTLLWRLRNLKDFANQRLSYHFPKEQPGPSGEVVIPASINGLVYEGSAVQSAQEVSLGGLESLAINSRSAIHQFVKESMVPAGVEATNPLFPGDIQGVVQQGFDISGIPAQSNFVVTYNAFQFDCLGDELVIFITKNTIVDDNGVPVANIPTTWQFQTWDNLFARWFGQGSTPDMGIYLFTGSNP